MLEGFDRELQKVDYVPPAAQNKDTLITGNVITDDAGSLTSRIYAFTYCLALSGYANKAAEILRNRVIENQDWFLFSRSWRSNGPAHAIRQTAEFKALLSELGLVDHYRQHGWPDLCRPLGEEDFECG